MTIDTVPDDVLLYVFDFYLAEASEVEAWNTLVHVCRRWRIVVFRSPRRLNLRIACTNVTPVEEMLDVWPALPIVISSSCDCPSRECEDNIMTALSHHRRVCQIDLFLSWDIIYLIFDVLEEQPQPFTELTALKLHSPEPDDYYDDVPPIRTTSGTFVSGATHLQSLSFTCLPYPGLPNLLLSSTDLVDLRLMEIPFSVFIYPDEMVTTLSALTRLQVFHLGPDFDKDNLHIDWENRRLPLPTRAVLPSLIELKFEGAIEYLEDFMARIDSPLLDRLDIVVFFPWYQVIAPDTHTPQLLQFISHIPKLRVLAEAHIGIDNFNFQARKNFLSTQTSSGVPKLEISCQKPELQFPFLAQFCRSPFFPLPTLENLYIDGGTYSRQNVRDDVENTQWLELLQPFTSVKNLYLSSDFASGIAPALEDSHGKVVTEVLPALENVFIEKLDLFGPVYVTFRDFAATRQLSSGRPIAVSDWDRAGREAGH